MKLNDNDIRLLRGIGNVAAGFSLIVALTMIFSLVQLKTIDPLENPVLVSVKEQYDSDPSNANYAEQVRAIDLMARKAYFSSRWQVETGSYLLLAGAVVFILCHRLIAGNERSVPEEPGKKTDPLRLRSKTGNSLIITSSVIFVVAIFASFILRNNLPDTLSSHPGLTGKAKETRQSAEFKPDKTNYPFFRGQDSRGIAGGSGYPTEWSGQDGDNIKWKTEIPKPGKSSPVIWEDKIFITGAEGLQCEIYCIDKQTGNIIWTVSGSDIPGEPSEIPEMDPDAGMAVSTVATNGNEVCAVFANGNLVCADTDGNIKWSKNIGLPENIYGYSSSLIIYEGLLIVKYDDIDKLSIIAFDVNTGELKWETPRQGTISWSSPVIGIFDGQAQVIINGNPYVTGYDPVSGKELWSVDCMYGDVAPSVAVNSRMVYAVTDYVNLVAIEPGQNAKIVWEDNYFTPDVSSPVANDEFLFIATGYGDVACYNAESGDTLWTKYFRDQFYASPVIADNMVYFLDRSGVMHIVRAEAEYQFVAEPALGEATDCTPAFSDKEIFIRAKNDLYCISKK